MSKPSQIHPSTHQGEHWGVHWETLQLRNVRRARHLAAAQRFGRRQGLGPVYTLTMWRALAAGNPQLADPSYTDFGISLFHPQTGEPHEPYLDEKGVVRIRPVDTTSEARPT